MASLLETLLIALGLSSSSIDWCQMQTEYCDGMEHIACEPNSFSTPSNVRNIQVVQFSDADRQRIVDRHNDIRRKVAQGEEPGFPDASKMEEMIWDDDLAFVAGEHAKHGNMAYDQCRSFTTYPNAGQNLATGESPVPYASAIDEVLNHINAWYNEEMPIVRDGLIDCVGKFTNECLKAGHFTVMVKEKCFAVGCAAVTYEKQVEDEWYYTVMTTCDYANTNLLNEAVYTEGDTCSACASLGKSCSNGLCA